jgi:hypothetical protein
VKKVRNNTIRKAPSREALEKILCDLFASRKFHELVTNLSQLEAFTPLPNGAAAQLAGRTVPITAQRIRECGLVCIRLFVLTEPVCMKRNIWHEVIADEPSSVFIADGLISEK